MTILTLDELRKKMLSVTEAFPVKDDKESDDKDKDDSDDKTDMGKDKMAVKESTIDSLIKDITENNTDSTALNDILMSRIAGRLEEMKESAMRSIDSGTHRIHTIDANGELGPRIQIRAMDDESANEKAKSIVGNKPYRGYTVHKVERVVKG